MLYEVITPYVQRLSRVTKNALLDRILRMGLIEARSYERFALLAEHADGELGALFNDLKDVITSYSIHYTKLYEGHSPLLLRVLMTVLSILFPIILLYVILPVI